MTLPSDADIEALHRKYAPNEAAYDLVYTHCRIVADIAVQLIKARNLEVNQSLVHAGCLLHDIGVYEVMTDAGLDRPDRPYITHGIRGQDILRQEGLPEALSRIPAHHTGVGITRQQIEAQGLPLPPGDYLAGTTEEALVMYADKFHSKSQPPHFNAADTYRRHVSQFGPDAGLAFDQLIKRFGLPDLGHLSQKYGHTIK